MHYMKIFKIHKKNEDFQNGKQHCMKWQKQGYLSLWNIDGVEVWLSCRQ